MSVKRQAATDLNHDNWDEEESSEQKDMGEFKIASKEVLEKRVIRTAKRRTQDSNVPTKSVFSGFGGFNKTQPSSFDFLANLTNGTKNTNGSSSTTSSETSGTSGLFSSKPLVSSASLFTIPTISVSSTSQSTPLTPLSSFGAAVKTTPSTLFSASKADSTVNETPFKIQSVSSSDDNKISKAATVPATNIFGVSSSSANDSKSLFSSTNSTSFKIQPVSSSTPATEQASTGLPTKPEIPNTPEKKDEDKESEKKLKFYKYLKALNVSVSEWISKHVAQNPLCILTPIFDDYEKHLKQITADYKAEDAPKKSDDSTTNKSKDIAPNTSTSIAFGINKAEDTKSSTSPSNTTPKPSIFGAKDTGTPIDFGINKAEDTKISTSPLNTTSKPSIFGAKDTDTPIAFGINKAEGTKITTSPLNTTSKPSIFGAKDAGTPIAFGINKAEDTKVSTSPLNTTLKPSIFSAKDNPLISSSNDKANFSFGIQTSANNRDNTTTTFTNISLGVTSPATTTSSFLINPNTSTNQNSTPFSFGIGKPFSFSPNNLQQQSLKPAAEENEEEEPPKVEYAPVKEENSVYEEKCKIFVKKDGNFADKGVGTLYIKKIEESGKHQLLVRANTNLGTVLLNLVLVSAIPTQRMGKNNVMLVCIPTPDSKPPPTPVLIRVKTSEDADRLLETLNKYKG